MVSVTNAAPATLAATSEVAAGSAQFLSPVVLDLEALVVNGKQAHWHVRGGSFIGVHELLDDVVAHAQEFADTASYAEKLALVRCLFIVSATDQSVSMAEEAEIHRIANQLRIDPGDLTALRVAHRQYLPGLSSERGSR